MAKLRICLGEKLKLLSQKIPSPSFSLLRSWNIKHQQLCDEIHTHHCYGVRSFGQLAISPKNKNLPGEKVKLLS
jgi:hypothetical protein